MTASRTTVLLRLVAFTVAALTLALAFGGAALAAPAASCGAPTCDHVAPEATTEPQPEPDAAWPTAEQATEAQPEPTSVTPAPPEPTWHAEPEPTWQAESEPAAWPTWDRPTPEAGVATGAPTSVTPTAATTTPEATEVGPAGGLQRRSDAAAGPAGADEAVLFALLAALVAVLLGGGWLASAIARLLSTGRRS